MSWQYDMTESELLLRAVRDYLRRHLKPQRHYRINVEGEVVDIRAERRGDRRCPYFICRIVLAGGDFAIINGTDILPPCGRGSWPNGTMAIADPNSLEWLFNQVVWRLNGLNIGINVMSGHYRGKSRKKLDDRHRRALTLRRIVALLNSRR